MEVWEDHLFWEKIPLAMILGVQQQLQRAHCDDEHVDVEIVGDVLMIFDFDVGGMIKR